MNSLHLFIQSRQKVVFEGDIAALTSTNKKGVFDILPEHENFISLLDTKLTIKHLDGRVEEIPVNQGVLHVANNHIKVFEGIKTGA